MQAAMSPSANTAPGCVKRCSFLSTANRTEVARFHHSQGDRRVGLDFAGKAIRHVSEQQDPERKRQAEQRKLQHERQRIDDRHQGYPDRPGREQRRKNFVAIMRPGKEVAERLHGNSAVLPFVSKDTEWRRKKYVVAKLVDTDFPEDDGKRHDVA